MAPLLFREGKTWQKHVKGNDADPAPRDTRACGQGQHLRALLRREVTRGAEAISSHRDFHSLARPCVSISNNPQGYFQKATIQPVLGLLERLSNTANLTQSESMPKNCHRCISLQEQRWSWATGWKLQPALQHPTSAKGFLQAENCSWKYAKSASNIQQLTQQWWRKWDL